MALRIIDKEKKEIRWKGLPTGGSVDGGETEALRQGKIPLLSLSQPFSELVLRRDRVKKKQEYLNDLETQYVLYKNLIDRNMRSQGEENMERVQLPFIVIHTKKDTGTTRFLTPDVTLSLAIECEMSEDRTEYFFDFSAPFSIHDDNEILKRMGFGADQPPSSPSKLSRAPKS